MSKNSSKNNKIFNRNNFANWVIGGIIALFIGKIMEPLFTYIFSFLLNIGGSLITYISNSTYREISNGYSEQSASSTFYLVYLCIFCVLGYMVTDIAKEYQTIKSKINQITNPAHTSKNNSVIPSESPTQNIEKVKKKIKLSYLYLIIIFVFLLISLIFFYGRSNFIRNKTITLTNNIEIVSPYISDAEYKQLKSKFHSMETQSDYGALMKELETIADEYSLKLK